MTRSVTSARYFDYATRLLCTGRIENVSLAMSQDPLVFLLPGEAGRTPILEALRSLQFRANSQEIINCALSSNSDLIISHLVKVLVFEGPIDLLQQFFSKSHYTGCTINPVSGLAPIHLACHSFYSFLLRPYAQSKVEVFKTVLEFTNDLRVTERCSGMSPEDLVSGLNNSIPSREKKAVLEMLLASRSKRTDLYPSETEKFDAASKDSERPKGQVSVMKFPGQVSKPNPRIESITSITAFK